MGGFVWFFFGGYRAFRFSVEVISVLFPWRLLCPFLCGAQGVVTEWNETELF